jgi:hypothetical protein
MPDDPFAEALAYEDELPLGWEVVEQLPPGQRLATLNASNEALLRVREGLEEPARGTDENQELAQEFNRLESKLNLILELMAEWLRRQGDLPSALPVRFNAWGIAWEAEDLPGPDTLLRMQLYICPTFPKPLVLYGRVLRQEPAESGARAVVTFMDLSPGVVDGLERLVFRRHRREVAQLRGQLRDGAGRD